MKKILLSLFILFMPVCLWSGGVLFMAGGVESAECTSGTNVLTVAAGVDGLSLSSNAKGQSFSGISGEIYSIDFWIWCFSGESEIEMRYGPDSDLTTTYYGAETITCEQAAGWAEFVFEGTDTLVPGTTYYFGMVSNSGSNQGYKSDADYTGGIAELSPGATTWDMSTTGTGDAAFRINTCDN